MWSVHEEVDLFTDRFFRFLRVLTLLPSEWTYLKAARASGLFDADFYRGAHPRLNPIYRRIPLHHYIAYGESQGYRPNPHFSPFAYLRHNPDVADSRTPPFMHFVQRGRHEGRLTENLPQAAALPAIAMPKLRAAAGRTTAPYAIVAHIYYPDLWEEFEQTLSAIPLDFDLYVTLTWRGPQSEELMARIHAACPGAQVLPMPNKGRDILPFVALVNAGLLDGYRAVCKLHTKKSPHRMDGNEWRRHLIAGILPPHGLADKVEAFLADPKASFWVADGQHYTGQEWWGSNVANVRDLLARLEIAAPQESLSFPAGSMYWMTPLMLGMIRSLHMETDQFEGEFGQVDGTLAHAFERALGFIAAAAGKEIRQTSQIGSIAPPADAPRPDFTSAFYLPQFHPTPENDAWWGKGFTEWRQAVNARPAFTGHIQPMLPADLGFYDLRITETMAEQAALARDAGIDAFCVYHYWFDGQRILEKPIDNLLARTDVDFPFYLCWANESWRRNWDGLSGTVLMQQSYAEGFEEKLVNDTLPYMRDRRYACPDGTRPRFVIYRPEDMPDPAGSVARMRAAWRHHGLDIELGAVRFHIEGQYPVTADLFDFWIEMPPHGLVKEPDYLFGGPKGNCMPVALSPGFDGLIYNYSAIALRACSDDYRKTLPANTIAGIMPSWDNTARRGANAHVAWGGSPATFDLWLENLRKTRIEGSYRKELFLNAWNEWAEKAVLEPSQNFGHLYLEILAKHVRKPEGRS